MFEDVWKHFDENELTHSAAHHLMAVHELRRRHGYARVSDIAQHLKITKGSVSSAMKQLKEREYVKEDHNKFLELTDKGLKVVQETETTRLVVQKFLTDALGMDEDDAQIDACKVEHLVSSKARARAGPSASSTIRYETDRSIFLSTLLQPTFESMRTTRSWLGIARAPLHPKPSMSC